MIHFDYLITDAFNATIDASLGVGMVGGVGAGITVWMVLVAALVAMMSGPQMATGLILVGRTLAPWLFR